MSKGERVGWMSRLLENQFVKSFLIFSVFRAIYGAGILVITYLLATSEEAPIWISMAFLLSSMVISRIIFKAIKRNGLVWRNLRRSKWRFKPLFDF